MAKPIAKSRRTFRHFKICAIAGFLFSQELFATTSEFSFEGYINGGSGYASNIYRLPWKLQDLSSGLLYNPSHGDGFANGGFKLRPEWDIDSRNRLLLTATGSARLFFANPSAHEFSGTGELEYRFRPVRTLWLRASAFGGNIRELAVDESADDATSMYRYWHYGAQGKALLLASKLTDYALTYRLTISDHEERPVADSLDNTQHEAVLVAEYRFGSGKPNSALTFEGTYLYKKYLALPSYDASAQLSHLYPQRAYHYLSLIIGYSHDFGVAKWEFADRIRYRVDAFENFYTYLENKISSGIKLDFSRSTRINLDGAWRYRYYTVRTAAQPGQGADPNLAIYYYDLSADIKQRLAGSLYLNIQYLMTTRLTNTGILYFRSYRSYWDNSISANLRWEW